MNMDAKMNNKNTNFFCKPEILSVIEKIIKHLLSDDLYSKLSKKAVWRIPIVTA